MSILSMSEFFQQQPEHTMVYDKQLRLYNDVRRRGNSLGGGMRKCFLIVTLNYESEMMLLFIQPT
jgi:hypothetical protein